SRATAQILGEQQNWQAEYAYFNAYESALQQAGIDNERLAHRAQLNWNGRLGESRPISASARYEHFDSGRDRLRTELRFTQRFSDFNWSSSLNHNLDDNETNRLTGGSLISYRGDDVNVNGQLSYALTPRVQARAANVTANWKLNDTMNARVNLSKAFDGNQDDNVRVNLSKRLERWIVSLASSYNFKRDFNISVNIFTSANRTPAGYALANRSKVATASASARVFLDNNGNRIFDEGDETVPGARLRLSAGRRPERSDDNGRILITDLPTNQEVSVRLNEGSLEDPYWLPLVPAYRMRLRPGQTYHFEFPLAQSAEIDGTVWLQDENSDEAKPASNVVVELLGEDGTIVKSGRSSYDGFYLFDQIVPGHYTLRISPQQLQRLNLQVDAEFDLMLNGNGDIKTGMDFQLTEINL
ncbi:MAG: carboxypeptidase-like regulatory domain-containing protein, partial [Xanthomonadales bacterium]|nr:carboxypeptidase-like regulatory domain-containing protein [Xanthomonadales bacterium]